MPIKRKTCKYEGCEKYSPIGLRGYCWEHLPEEIKKEIGTKIRLAQKNKNARFSAMTKIRKFEREKEGGEKSKSDLWFAARHLEMTGKCIFCGGRTCKDSTIFKNSICHLFEKANFKSIKWHPENWFEACFYGNSHHTNFDNKIFTFETIKRDYPSAWSEIVRKTKILYPLMTSHEQGRVPDILIQELNNVLGLGSLFSQREIKFRAWNLITKTMIDLKKITPLALNMDTNGLFIPFSDELPIMQYTGLKDKKGKDIYEGDMCLIFTDEPTKVVFENGAFGYLDSGGYFISFAQNMWFYWDSKSQTKNIEIIGNIFENPELLQTLR